VSGGSWNRLVDGVQAITGVSVVVFVVMLFVNDPVSPPPPVAGSDVPAEIDAAGIYGQSCAGCHGGDGSGGLGPPLKATRILERFANPADQAAVIANGRGRMPSFSSRLTAAEINAIVEYTRTALT
jgi:mono/diheme cytochrome c family protein